MLINNKNLIKTIKRVDLTNEQETNLNEIPNIKNNLNDIKNTELENLNTAILRVNKAAAYNDNRNYNKSITPTTDWFKKRILYCDPIFNYTE